MIQKRKRLSGPEKIAIGKRYLIERALISDLCDEPGRHRSHIHRCRQAYFGRGTDPSNLKKGHR